MAASQTFQDVRKELEDQWKYHSNNLFPVYTTVTKAALDKLVDKLPQNLKGKQRTMHRKVSIKRKVELTKPKKKTKLPST